MSKIKGKSDQHIHFSMYLDWNIKYSSINQSIDHIIFEFDSLENVVPVLLSDR